MKRIRIKDLSDVTEGQALQDILPGKHLYRGGLTFMEPGQRSHSNDGPDGKDYHVHKDCEAFLILEGQGFMEVNKTLHSIGVGDLIIIEPGEDHHLISGKDHPVVSLWCHAGLIPQKKR